MASTPAISAGGDDGGTLRLALGGAGWPDAMASSANLNADCAVRLAVDGDGADCPSRGRRAHPPSAISPRFAIKIYEHIKLSLLHP